MLLLNNSEPSLGAILRHHILLGVKTTINTHCHLTTYKQDFSEAMGALYENNSRRHEAFLSRRDFMSVAWQFSAWNDAKEKAVS